MTSLKPWTVMVYLAADNNLNNSAVDSLKQMKAAATDNINVVAQFDTGPRNSTQRYHFDGKERFGPLENNRVAQFSPNHAGDPQNLTDFIVWAGQQYPAKHYLTVIWGHGGGVDDAFPQAFDGSFAPQPYPANLQRIKGVLDFPQKGVLDFPQKGHLSWQGNNGIGSSWPGILQAVENGFQVLHSDFLHAMEDSLNQVLDIPVLEAVVNALRAAGMPVSQNQDLRNYEDTLKEIRGRISSLLKEEEQSVRGGALYLLKHHVAAILEKGINAAFRANHFFQLQKDVLEALDNKEPGSLEERLRTVLRTGFLRAFKNGILEALKISAVSSADPALAGVKSLAFVGHPATFMSNVDVKKAIERASDALQHRIDVVGMDACNMSMVEVGYELSDVVDFMVAAQGSIPEESWPYDRILAHLGEHPDISPSELSSLIVNNYVASYTEYFNHNVALSALDLRESKHVIQRTAILAAILARASADVDSRAIISSARESIKASFGQHQFIDLVEFCEFLSGAKENLELARAASDLLAALRPFIAHHKSTGKAESGNGASIYFPLANRTRLEHQQKLGELYSQLDFAKMTGWDDFVNRFVKREIAQVIAAEESDRIRRAMVSANFQNGGDIAAIPLYT